MSIRNTTENKYTRKATRGLSKLPRGTEPVGRIPQNISANILSNPKQMKLSGRSRRRLQRGRGLAIAVERPQPKNFAVKDALRLTRLTLEQLHRRLAQCARRASTCKHLIADLSPGSQFAIGIRSEQTRQLSLARQVRAELKIRERGLKSESL